jgi:hypothetical protein
MAVYRLKDPETWLPTWAQGKNLPCTQLKLKPRDGDPIIIDVPVEYQHGGYEYTTTDESLIRQLDVDPRFEKL